MTHLVLDEGKKPEPIPLDDKIGDALAESEVVSAVRLSGGYWEVAANNKVGVAQVAGLTLSIRPKVDIDRILFLLGYAKNPGWRDDTVELEDRDRPVPALAQAFRLPKRSAP